MQLKIYDSVQKEKVDFIPINPPEVRLYVCGPTVYDDSHLGHARSAIVFDLLRRVLREMAIRCILQKILRILMTKLSINRSKQV